ncbi:cation-translocating P-type ATPase [Fulvivirgaceae bacterium BMA12]|uniref:Cation-translocating P-type ATPase n=1 Tax=Agaribacillus aureus TaxID=3051825 RepID=A0ABT8LJ97_9BACT|nr:cation-translocating P-type ATPase [Fulvivirgaceae bacterium BMA12]
METRGLTHIEATKRLATFGRNSITQEEKLNPLKLLLQQFTSPLMLILIAAAIISLAIGLLPGQASNITDTVLILAIVFISGIFGFAQDYRAERTIEALQQMATPRARVVRDGKEQEIYAHEVVPGDLMQIDSGDIIAADGKIVASFHLEADESVLTGESHAVKKEIEDTVFMHSYVTAGNAEVLVTNTGMLTRIGKIAKGLQSIQDTKTSFQKELAQLGKKLSLLTLFVALFIALVGFFKYDVNQALMTAISLAVAAIPEGLPAVVVLALAAGAKVMFKKNALIRRLSIAESIGAVNVICTDKTGTLTKNEMTVTALFYDNKTQKVSSDKLVSADDKTARQLLVCGLVCNNIETVHNEDGTTRYLGKQTEIALHQTARHLLAEVESRHYFKVNEIPFNSERKMMSVVVEHQDDGYFVYTKGAPEILINKCTGILLNGEIKPLVPDQKQSILNQNVAFAKEALRVLGCAYKQTGSPDQNIESELVWIGLQAMIDPARDEVTEAIQDCKTAGIWVIMITGDNPITAGAIAKNIGLETTGTVEGTALDNMDEAALAKKLESGVNVFARTNPFHKLRILEKLTKKYNVAMTGDGVNDALALKKANVGIAMGNKGTEVARQASDIVLLDDNFSTIRDALKQGRTIFNNIRKFINYLLSCNLAEVGVIFIATVAMKLDGPVLLAVQILWINLLTDGLVALALGVDPPATDIMLKKPRKLNEPLINKMLTWQIGGIGLVMTVILLIAFQLALPLGIDSARTVLLTGFVLLEFVRIAVIRSEETLGWLANKWLAGALLLSLLMHLTIVYSPINTFFGLVPLAAYEWAVLAGSVFIAYWLAILMTRFLTNKIPTS